MNEKPAEYLDKILNALAEDFGKSLSLQELQNKVTPIEIFGTVGNVNFSPDLLVDSQHAIEFLRKKNLVAININDGRVLLTYEGYMKIKTKGFSKEIKEKSVNQTLQRIAWLIPIIISIIAILISLSKNSTPNAVSNSICCCHKDKVSY